MLNLKTLSCAAIIVAALLHPSMAFTQVYKSADANGKVAFLDQGYASDHSDDCSDNQGLRYDNGAAVTYNMQGLLNEHSY